MPDAVPLKDASFTRRRPVRRRIAELLTGAVIGALLGFLIWSLTSEAFWLWAAPILGALSFRFLDPSPATRAARDSVISPEVEDALHRAAALVEEAGRANVRPDDVLLYLLDLPTVARYLENEGIEVAALRGELESAVSRSSPTDPVSAGGSPAGSVELQRVVLRAIMQALSERRKVTVTDFTVLLLKARQPPRPSVPMSETDRARIAEQRMQGLRKMASSSERTWNIGQNGEFPVRVREALDKLASTDSLLAQIAEHYFKGYDEKEVAKILGLTQREVALKWGKAKPLLIAILARS